MSSVVHPIETESLADLPPGAAPSFGDLETGTAPDSAPLVLSEAAHRTISGPGPLDTLSGAFHLEDPLFDGELLVEPAGTPGLVHVHADISHRRGGIPNKGESSFRADEGRIERTRNIEDRTGFITGFDTN